MWKLFKKELEGKSTRLPQVSAEKPKTAEPTQLISVKRGEGKANLLSEEAQMEFVQMLGSWTRERIIIQHFKDHYGIEFTPYDVDYYRYRSSRWKPLIAKKRREFLEKIHEVPIYHKRVRLEKIQKMLEKAEELEEVDAPARKEKFDQQIKLLERAQSEAEKLPGTQTNILAIQYNSMKDEELLKVKDNIIRQIKKIGGNSNGRNENDENSSDPVWEHTGAGRGESEIQEDSPGGRRQGGIVHSEPGAGEPTSTGSQ